MIRERLILRSLGLDCPVDPPPGHVSWAVTRGGVQNYTTSMLEAGGGRADEPGIDAEEDKSRPTHQIIERWATTLSRLF